MNNEIKAFLVNIKENEDYKEIYDYITNLQERIDNAIEYIKWHYDLATEENVEFCLLRDRLLGILGDKE